MESVFRTRVTVREVMNSPVITASLDESVSDVAKLMATHRIGSVVIMKATKPVGIVTETDIVAKSVAQGKDPLSINAGEIMSHPLITIEAGDHVADAARVMRKHSVKRVGVVHQSELVGIVSTSDLTAVTPELFDILSDKARLLGGEGVRMRVPLAGYCDQCGEWSDYLRESDGRYLCEECSGEAVSQPEAEAASESFSSD